VRKSCTVCGGSFEAKRAAAKTCGDRCRQRAHRSPQAASEPKVLELPAESTSEPSPAGSVTTATAAELEQAGRLETALGQAALALARRIDTGASETGSSFASLARQHREALAEAVRDAKKAADPLDELRARRERKRDAG
jgi:hypothetical protein